jgi:hypothetical protein
MVNTLATKYEIKTYLFSLSPGHQLPNLCSRLQRPSLNKAKQRRKARFRENEDPVLVPVEIDQALEQVPEFFFLLWKDTLDSTLALFLV